MTDKITTISDGELDAVGAGFFDRVLVAVQANGLTQTQSSTNLLTAFSGASQTQFAAQSNTINSIQGNNNF